MSTSPENDQQKREFNLSAILHSGLIGLAGTVLVGIGTYLLHFAPSGNYGDGFDYQFFHEIAEWRLTYGHFFIIFFSVFYLFGHWHIMLILHRGNKLLARAFFFSAVFGYLMALVWGSSRLMIGMAIKHGNTPETKNLTDYLITIYEGHYGVLLMVLFIVYLLNSILLVITIMKGGTLYPKWMALLNPALIVFSCYLIYILAPSIGKYLHPSSVNIANFILLSVSCWIVYQHQQDELK